MRYPVYVVAARQLFLYSICYFVIVAIAHVRHYATLSSERDVRAAQLEAQLSTARLAALQGQLRPHFLFNTLNMIAEQVYTDPRGADAMLTKLGVLLRSSFVEADLEEVPLRRELELLDSYLDIMGARFNGRLRVTRDVDPQTLDALVPRFVLQPLVENAIKHGIEPREEGGEVTIAARLFPDAVEIVVADDGDGIGEAPIRAGTGVHNTRERLRHLYGEGRQAFSLTSRDGGGAVARLVLPYRAGEAAPAPRSPTTSGVAHVPARHGRALAREGVAR
jgi:LytS/YehU family sensor histidine kinase